MTENSSAVAAKSLSMTSCQDSKNISLLTGGGPVETANSLFTTRNKKLSRQQGKA